MKNNLYEIYTREIEKIIKEENNISLFLVGSSKKYNLKLDYNKINDIDLFVICNQSKKQVRIIKEIDGYEFDINYFSKSQINEFINDKEYFFLKEMKDAKVINDKENSAKELINLCAIKYAEGPDKVSDDEREILKQEIILKIDTLKDKNKFDTIEYMFLTNLFLKDIIVGYFTINNKWIPKDKKLFKELRKEDNKVFELIQKTLQNYKYEDLLSTYNYIFKN